MTDLSETIAPKSDQLNADDLIGKTMTVKITKVSRCKEPEQPIAINFEGDGGKPYKPGKSMRRVLVNTWGGDGNSYVGRSLTLYRDDEVVFGGLKVGGIRISNMSHITHSKTMALTASRASRKPFTVQPMKEEPPTDSGAPLWFVKLTNEYGACETVAEVDAISARDAVARALENAPPAIQAQLRALDSGARARIAEAAGAVEDV